MTGMQQPILLKSIDHHSVLGHVEAVSLELLIELEDKQQAIQQVVCSASVIISYHVKKCRQLPKMPENVEGKKLTRLLVLA